MLAGMGGESALQSLSYYGKTQGFTLSIEPYDPETYVDYDKALSGRHQKLPYATMNPAQS